MGFPQPWVPWQVLAARSAVCVHRDSPHAGLGMLLKRLAWGGQRVRSFIRSWEDGER